MPVIALLKNSQHLPTPSVGRCSCSRCMPGSDHLTCSSSNIKPLGMGRAQASVSPRLGQKQQEGLAGEGRARQLEDSSRVA